MFKYDHDHIARLSTDIAEALEGSPEDIRRLVVQVLAVQKTRVIGTGQYRPVDSYLFTFAILADHLHELDTDNPTGPWHAADDVVDWILDLADGEVWATIKCGLVALERRGRSLARG